MTTKELQKYAYEQKRRGLSESQIARSLGMSLAHFMGILNGVDIEKVEAEAPKKHEVKKPKTEKPVSGAEEVVTEPAKEPEPEVFVEEPKPEEDFNWMEN